MVNLKEWSNFQEQLRKWADDISDLKVREQYLIYCLNKLDLRSEIEKWSKEKQLIEEMKGYDVDMNLCYRWDVNKKTGEDLTGSDAGYYAELFTVLQRKGRVTSHFIENFTEDDIPLLQEYLKPHIETLQKIWAPFELGTKQEIRNQKIQDII